MAYTVSWEAKRVCVRYFGHCTEDTVLKAVIQLQADPRFDSTFQALHDFSGCEQLDYSVPHMEELAARNVAAAHSNTRLHIAVVTQRDDVRAMLKCFDEIGLNPYPLKTFADRSSADRWLNGQPHP